jgi:DNA-binding CsgD family transcriptional regulator
LVPTGGRRLLQNPLWLASPEQVMQNCHMAEDLSAVIDASYAAAMEPRRWPAVAAQVASFFDSESTSIQIRRGKFETIALRASTLNHDAASQQAYIENFHKLDLWANGWRAIGKDGIYTGGQLVDPVTLRNSEYYRDFCRARGIFHFIGAGVTLDAQTRLLIGIHRPEQREDFTPRHRRRLELLLPHLSRAAQMQMLLAATDVQRRLLHEVFERLSVAVIVVDVTCRVVFTSLRAEQLLHEGDGLAVQQGRLSAREPVDHTILQRAVTRASALSVGRIATVPEPFLLRRRRKLPLPVLVAPLAGATWLESSSAIVFVNDQDTRPVGVAACASRYGLTSAESRLLEALLAGERIAQYAERLGISINTANTQLKQIFSKTDTNRQAELMRKLLSDPLMLLMRESDGRQK